MQNRPVNSDIFKERKNIHPYEYPELTDYMKAIQHSFWLPEHFTYDRDVLDFKTNLTSVEQDVIRKSMLAIGVVENKVKTFWARIDIRLPKPEIANVGHTFASNEVIHQETYKKLLELLGLEKEFENIDDIPCMKGRSEYLTKYLKGVSSRSDKEFTKSLILFTMLVENASLFSQFLIIAAFRKHKNMLSNFSAVVGATAREEQVHSKFGESLITIIKSENPDWFDQDMEDKIRRNINKAYKAEAAVLDWIFESGELDFLSKESVKEYLKDRFNQGLNGIGYTNEFEIDSKLLESSNFFNVQLKASSSFDFFNEKSIDYSQNSSFDEDNIWEE